MSLAQTLVVSSNKTQTMTGGLHLTVNKPKANVKAKPTETSETHRIKENTVGV